MQQQQQSPRQQAAAATAAAPVVTTEAPATVTAAPVPRAPAAPPAAAPSRKGKAAARRGRGLQSSMEFEAGLKNFWYPAEFSSVSSAGGLCGWHRWQLHGPTAHRQGQTVGLWCWPRPCPGGGKGAVAAGGEVVCLARRVAPRGVHSE